MGIVSVALQSRNCSINEKSEPSYSHVYLVRTDNKLQNLPSIRSAPGIAIGDSYFDDSFAGCNGVDSQPYGEDGFWHTVTVNWGPWPEREENPLNEPTQVEWNLSQFELEVEKDRNGKPIVNAAGMPPRDILTKDDSRPILTVTHNEASFNGALAYSYRDTVNRAAFFNAPRGTVKVMNISASRQFSPICGFFYQVKYEFAFNLDGWAKEFLNCGTHELDAGKLKPILINGKPTDEPVPLTRAGAKLPAGAAPVMLKFDVYHEADFGAFNLE
ncbi:hypothetical protein [Anatilimnocola floriformis]|uniref:hypothetical protein n=1 Tax=Anatilimnocola floriformis TaxID=2948575 RepID=UPI0020C34407|nr:hypothetical protein [Anatilimnocola floriformis]